jgi:hypothetical protein
MIPRSKVADDGGEPGPEGVGGNSALGGGFLGDEIEQDGSDFQSMGINTIHDGIFLTTTAAARGFQGKEPRKGAC